MIFRSEILENMLPQGASVGISAFQGVEFVITQLGVCSVDELKSYTPEEIQQMVEQNG